MQSMSWRLKKEDESYHHNNNYNVRLLVRQVKMNTMQYKNRQ